MGRVIYKGLELYAIAINIQFVRGFPRAAPEALW